MTIIKAIKEKGTDRKSLYKKKDYLTADSKTNGGKFVVTFNCMSPYVIEEMLSVKRIFHKSGGRCWFEYVISPTPDIPSRANEDYLELAKEIANLFPGFQCICVLHLDTKTRHLHFLFNTVSIRDGRKYPQSPSGLHTLKQETNDILMKYASIFASLVLTRFWTPTTIAMPRVLSILKSTRTCSCQKLYP